MKMFGHRVFLALLCSMLTMCGGGRNTPGDGGMDDGGVDDGNGHSARVLRRTISVDLAQVSALVVLAQTPSGSALTAGNSRADALEPGASPGQLVAVTLTG